MNDDGKGTKKKNKKVITGGGGGGGGGHEPQGHFIVDNPDPEHQIQRVRIHEGAVEVIDNIPIEEARRIFEAAVENPENTAIASLKEKLEKQADYEPTPAEVEAVEAWVSRPKIWLDEGSLQRMYDYPAGSVWDFFLHVLGKRRIPGPLERIETGYDTYIRGSEFTDAQVEKLRQVKEVFLAALKERGEVNSDSIFGNPIYEQIIGSYDEVNRLFDGRLAEVIQEMQENFHLSQLTRGVA